MQGGSVFNPALSLRPSINISHEFDNSSVMSCSNLQELQQLFKKQGWNRPGANLLAAGCLVAQSAFLYVRPSLLRSDIVKSVVIALVGVLIPLGPFNVIGIIAGLVCGGCLLLWKAGGWRPADEIIRSALDRPTQSKLVRQLILVCEICRVDPDDLDNLADSLGGREARQVMLSVEQDQVGLAGRLHQALLGFFRNELKMEE